jgi:predicted nucleic-acid-binding Zn-ribbon protein
MVFVCPKCGSTEVVPDSHFMSIISAPSTMKCLECGFTSIGMPDVKDPEEFKKKFL